MSTMTIGDFSRATRLSAKALRFYHRVGLLEPALVDPVNGYRLYDPDQIPDAQVIRHFRALEMPVEIVREVLAAPTVDRRNDLIAAHLTQMEARLEATRSAVASLRGLLEPQADPLAVTHRTVPATPALVVRAVIDLADLSAFYLRATAELAQVIATTGTRPVGPRGGLWATELFLDERGSAALYVPVEDLHELTHAPGGAVVELLPAVDLAVATHRGTDATMAQTYGALGAYVARHELSVDGPIREVYVEEPSGPDGLATTEIGWPVFRTA